MEKYFILKAVEETNNQSFSKYCAIPYTELENIYNKKIGLVAFFTKNINDYLENKFNNGEYVSPHMAISNIDLSNLEKYLYEDIHNGVDIKEQTSTLGLTFIVTDMVNHQELIFETDQSDIEDLLYPKVKEEQKRGQLTQRIKDESVEFLGREITLQELRLLPYIMECILNLQKFDFNKITSAENQILMEFVEGGFITGRNIYEKFNVSKDFYNFITEILYLGYVDLT